MNMIYAPQPQPATALHPWLPQTFDQLIQFAESLANSHLVPKSYQGKRDDCLVALQFGAFMGIHPMQALQNIAVINGRPSLWGDAVLALVRASPLCESVSEKREGDTAICTVKRRGEAPQTRTFSVNDARRAGLWSKPGPWRDYPARMLQMRARSFALRDVFPDVLLGIHITEEVQDIPVSDNQSMNTEIIEIQPESTLPDYPQECLDTNLYKWQSAIEQGKQTTIGIINMIETRYRLSEAQKAQIVALENQDELSDSSSNSSESTEG